MSTIPPIPPAVLQMSVGELLARLGQDTLQGQLPPTAASAPQSPPEADDSRPVPLKIFAAGIPWPSVKRLRWMIYCDRNGFVERCIRHAGRSVLIIPREFWAWIEEHEADRLEPPSVDAKRPPGRPRKVIPRAV